MASQEEKNQEATDAESRKTKIQYRHSRNI